MPDDDIGDRLHSLLRASQAVVQELDLPVVLRLIAEEAVRLVDDAVGVPAGSTFRGLANLRTRAAGHGGSLEVVGGERGGTTLRWTARLIDG